jgi:hypothetical protein
VAWGLHDSVQFEKQGRPAVTVITTAFETAAGVRAVVLGLPDHPTVMVDHPLTGRSPAEVEAMAGAAAARVAAGLTREAAR